MNAETNDIVERLRTWIWDQREKHGDDLVALSPAFDLILNKIDELAAEALALQGAGWQPGLVELRAANVARQAVWCPEQVPDLSFRGNELAGEVGEACNVIKKLERERLGWKGSRDTVAHLGEELADIIICTDLVALSAGIDLASAVVGKFNSTSEKVGIPVFLPPPPQGGQ